MGETRVDLLHLLEDLRDAYPGSLEETILTEIVANALDSGAATIRLVADSAESTLTAIDDGAGMRRRDLARYHDIASSGKTRGQGIGFAGVGIKLGLLASTEVMTESRSGTTHVATIWHLANRRRAPWRWVPPPGLVAGRGTAVRLRLENPLSALLDPGYLEAAVRRHFEPLLDPRFGEILGSHYPDGVRIEVNGRPPAPAEPSGDWSPVAIRFARKRKPSAFGYLERHVEPLPEEQRGIALSTFGKVIKRGWDWLGLMPAAADRVTGTIEAPALAESLTLSKADFIRTGPRGASYLTYRKAIQEAVAAQLALWGDQTEAQPESRRRHTRPVERDLEHVLVELARTFPLLASLVEHRRGGQRRLPLGGPVVVGPAAPEPEEATVTGGESPEVEQAEPEAPAERSPPAEPEPLAGPMRLPGGSGKRRPARYGLTIQFEHRPDDPTLGRLRESTVWVNEAHPAYRRAVASRSEGYHLALAVGMALAPLAVPPAETHGFVTAFLARWGESADDGGKRKARSRR
ncbi:MAG: ATP-binding protein [Gemmatimonadales bacterium]